MRVKSHLKLRIYIARHVRIFVRLDLLLRYGADPLLSSLSMNQESICSSFSFVGELQVSSKKKKTVEINFGKRSKTSKHELRDLHSSASCVVVTRKMHKSRLKKMSIPKRMIRTYVG